MRTYNKVPHGYGHGRLAEQERDGINGVGFGGRTGCVHLEVQGAVRAQAGKAAGAAVRVVGTQGDENAARLAAGRSVVGGVPVSAQSH